MNGYLSAAEAEAHRATLGITLAPRRVSLRSLVALRALLRTPVLVRVTVPARDDATGATSSLVSVAPSVGSAL